MTIARQIGDDQVEAALQIQSGLVGWKAANSVLSSLRSAMPAHDYESALAKTAVLNQLYFTNVMATFRMAQHISALADDGRLYEGSATGVVERIASLDGDAAKRKHWVFASKYAHFFIDNGRFPIYDRLAADVVLFHTGERVDIANRENPYSEFYERFERVRGGSPMVADYCCGDMDAYLWLTGCYRRWLKRGERADINREVYGYLAGTERSGTSEKERLLRRLIPDEYFTDFAK